MVYLYDDSYTGKSVSAYLNNSQHFTHETIQRFVQEFQEFLKFHRFISAQVNPVFIACHKELWIIDAWNATMFSMAMRIWEKW